MKTTALLAAVLCLAALAADDAAIAPRPATSLKPQAPSFETDAIAIPRMLSYQGKLTDTFGLPVTDTTYSVDFRLYSVPSGGSPFWNETQTVRTRGGLFSTLLGSVTPIGTMPDAGAVYLGMVVAGGAEMAPRLRIASAAYAYLAERAANSDQLQGKDTTGLDARYVNEAQANSVSSAMIANGTIAAVDLNQMGAGTGQVMKWTGSAWAPRNDSIGGGGGGTVTSVSQATGAVCTPNPITTTGTVGFDQTYGDGRYVNEAQANSVTGAMITDGQVSSADIRDTTVNTAELKNAAVTAPKLNQMGATTNQVLKWTGSAWAPANDSAGAGDNAWVRSGSDSVLYTVNNLGIARAGNVLHGTQRFTHVNLGVQCTTGTSGQNYTYATVGGGYNNTASNTYATVGGGYGNTAVMYATVGGGYSNAASNFHSTVSGGDYDTASGQYSTVSGGSSNTASYTLATVGGGWGNTAGGYCATVGGGYVDTAVGYASGALSGWHNVAGDQAADTCAVVAGGRLNRATAKYATVGGGYNNTASGVYATVAGGHGDTAMAVYSGALSGWNNVAGDAAVDTGAVVAGGRLNRATAKYATVGGGISNAASNTYATVAGGYNNQATGYAATVSCGYSNAADTTYATVADGYNNQATGYAATVGGGYSNTASGFRATVGGGDHNTASDSFATVAGGYADTSASRWSFTTGRNSVVPVTYTNSAAFNGQRATAANQTRVGVLSKASGTFTIDHPLDPHGKILNHYFIEGPEMRNIYDGEAVLDASGRAVVTLPDYFDALNRKPRVQLTGVGTSEVVYVAEKVSGNRFVIGGPAGAEVYWQVTGERKDVSAEATRRMMPVEQPKTGDLAGTMLDDDFLSGCVDQLVREGKAQGIDFRTAGGRARYERTEQHLREAGQQ